MSKRRYRFYVEIETDDPTPGEHDVGTFAIHDALYEADSHAQLHRHGCGFVSEISVWQMKRRPRLPTS